MHPPRILIIWFRIPSSLLCLTSAYARDGPLVWSSAIVSWFLVYGLVFPSASCMASSLFHREAPFEVVPVKIIMWGTNGLCAGDGDLCITRREFSKLHWHSPFHYSLGQDYSLRSHFCWCRDRRSECVSISKSSENSHPIVPHTFLWVFTRGTNFLLFSMQENALWVKWRHLLIP
jgi:hypothetical protein